MRYDDTLLRDKLMAEVPFSRSSIEIFDMLGAHDDVRAWAALSAFQAAGGNAWLFSGDARHFDQFLTERDIEALLTLSQAQQAALLATGIASVPA